MCVCSYMWEILCTEQPKFNIFYVQFIWVRLRINLVFLLNPAWAGPCQLLLSHENVRQGNHESLVNENVILWCKGLHHMILWCVGLHLCTKVTVIQGTHVLCPLIKLWLPHSHTSKKLCHEYYLLWSVRSSDISVQQRVLVQVATYNFNSDVAWKFSYFISSLVRTPKANTVLEQACQFKKKSLNTGKMDKSTF